MSILDEGRIIINGGNPLPGCPESYEEANEWANKANENKDEYDVPRWSFDCGFKLDFDGSLLCISSRFYPPKTHYGPQWDGTVSIMKGDVTLFEKEFETNSLDDLRVQVEEYVDSIETFLFNINWDSFIDKHKCKKNENQRTD